MILTNDEKFKEWLAKRIPCNHFTVVDMNSVTLSDDELKKLIDSPQTVIFFSPKFDPRLAATNLIDYDNVIVCNYKFALLCNLRHCLECN